MYFMSQDLELNLHDWKPLHFELLFATPSSLEKAFGNSMHPVVSSFIKLAVNQAYRITAIRSFLSNALSHGCYSRGSCTN